VGILETPVSGTGFYAAAFAALAGAATLFGAGLLTLAQPELGFVLAPVLVAHWAAGVLLVVVGALLVFLARRDVLVVRLVPGYLLLG
jgi:hypothetical protein